MFVCFLFFWFFFTFEDSSKNVIWDECEYWLIILTLRGPSRAEGVNQMSSGCPFQPQPIDASVKWSSECQNFVS